MKSKHFVLQIYGVKIFPHWATKIILLDGISILTDFRLICGRWFKNAVCFFFRI